MPDCGVDDNSSRAPCSIHPNWKSFGSALRDDFGPDSDLDFLVRFQERAPWDLLHIIEMQQELEGWFGRPVDLVESEQLENPIRKKRILDTRQILYAAG